MNVKQKIHYGFVRESHQMTQFIQLEIVYLKS